MRRRLTSWTALLVALLIMSGGVAFALTRLQLQVEERAHRNAIETASMVATLVVGRNLSVADLTAGRRLAATDSADMDLDVAALLNADRVVGLEVWDATGRLIYADPNHPAAEDTMPRDELLRTRKGVNWVAGGKGKSARGLDTVDVFLPWDPDDNGTREGVIEVLLPEDTITAAVQRSARRLDASAATLLLVVLGGLLLLRRRLLAREHDACHDTLTGLLNRPAIGEDIRLALARSKHEPRQSSALLMLDLDGFKAVNDTLGHPAGDTLLVQVARTLRQSVRAGDSVARLGGDEFAVLLTRLPDATKATELALQLLHRLSHESYEVQGIELGVDASIGVALIPDHGHDVDLILQRADVAMYQAKRNAAGVVVYDVATDTHDIAHLGLLVELRRAIATEQLVLHYQPKAQMNTREVVGVEALVRWQHPTRGLLGPGEFIPLAENTGLIRPLTEWVLAEAIRQAATWRDLGLMLSVAVNIAPRTLLEGNFPATVLDLLAEHGLPSHLLELEVTETAIMTDPGRAVSVLKHLNAMGVRVSIDDFGTGYTSLTYLKELPVQTLKIDRAFITDLLTSKPDEAITESVIGLGHKLGLTVLAEGVETEAVWQRLSAMACDEGQGFLLARPMPADQLTSWVTAHVVGNDIGIS
jgi:diguanylate cyclase (GGDEF)-like protein